MSRTTVLTLVFLVAAACGQDHGDHAPAGHPHGDGAESWAVTAWGERFEIFAEVEPLVAGEAATSHTHVTILDGFSPLTEGVVLAVLRAADGREQVFRRDLPVRPGIFSLDLEPEREGTFDLAFRIAAGGRREEIPAGRVQVGTAAEPGGLLDPPVQPASEPVPFLKEQQWRTRFATAPVTLGWLREVVRAPGRVRPKAGGEVLLTAPVAGLVAAASWPYVGLRVAGGAAVFEVVPQVAAERSLAGLEAAVVGLEAELEAARGRRGRLEELLALEAASPREAEEARAATVDLTARLAAARRDLDTARAARRGSGSGAERIPVVSPFSGTVAEVAVTPGEAVAAGAPLARLVRTAPLWIEVALSPQGAAALGGDPDGMTLRPAGGGTVTAFTAGQVRLVAGSPEVDAATGTVSALFEIPGGAGSLRPGGAVEVKILLPRRREGVVVPSAALVDDSGITVVYLQLSGESFERREVAVRAREGDRVLVEGLAPGERLVAQGGNAIRRASLVASGAAEGHVH